MTTILNLPDELLFMICEKINSVVDLVAFSCCSKRLNFICKESNLYHCDVYEIKNTNNFEKNIFVYKYIQYSNEQ